MKIQNQVEQLLKEIHLMVEDCKPAPEQLNYVIINKLELYEKLNDISKSMFDMMDEYAISQVGKEKTKRDLREQGEAIVDHASQKADDVYAASVLYMDEAITRLVHILDNAQKQADVVYKELSQSMETERRGLRSNQNELQDQMFDMRDSNLYLNVLDERRRKMEKAKTENQLVMPEIAKDVLNILQGGSVSLKSGKADVKVNPAYFEKAGRSFEEAGLDEPVKEAPDVKVNMNSNYFKWKMNQNKTSESVEKQE